MQFILIFLFGGGSAWSTIATARGGNTTQEPNWVFPREYLASSYTFLEVEEDTYMGKSFLTILVYIMYSSIFLHYSKKRYFEINLIKINWQFTLSLNSSASLFSAFRKYFSESTLDNAAMKRSFLGTCMKIM